MRIGVIGAGWLGGTVGELLARAGNEVMFASRHPDRLAGRVDQAGVTAATGTPAEAAAFGDVVLIAVPYRSLAPIGEELGPVLFGKVVIDACNPNRGAGDPADLVQDADRQGVALASAERLPGVRLVRCFSSVDATEVKASGTGGRGNPLAVPIAGDDQQAVAIVEGLVRDVGCEPVFVGGLADARGFQRGGPAFRAHVDADEMRRLLDLAD